MKEHLKHIEAFEYFYSLGGQPTEDNAKKVAEKFQISYRTFWNWYKKFNWKFRVEQRNIENKRKIEQKTDEAIIDTKADFRKTIFAIHQKLKEGLNKFIKEQKLEINNVSDIVKVAIVLDKLARLELELLGETGGVVNYNMLSDDAVDKLIDAILREKQNEGN